MMRVKHGASEWKPTQQDEYEQGLLRECLETGDTPTWRAWVALCRKPKRWHY